MATVTNPFLIRSEFEQLVTQASDNQNLSMDGLEGDTDGNYSIWGLITCSAAAQDITFEPENLATNQTSFFLSVSGGGPGANSTSNLFIGTNDDAAAATIHFQAWMQSKSGVKRLWLCRSYIVEQSGDYILLTNGLWTGTATPISQCRIHSSVSGGIKAGSFFAIRRELSIG